jgi:hypothetical protein
VFALKPETAADTATALLPDPGDGVHGALDPYELDVPYSSLHSLTSPPFGLTLPFNVAADWVTPDAGSVTTVGGLAKVFRDASAPKLVPPAFFATTRK